MTNKNKIKVSVLSLILVIIIASIPSPIFADGESEVPPLDLSYFMEIMDLIQQNYVYDISEEELVEGALKGLFYHTDPNSSYYTQEEFQELTETTSGDFVGIGVYIIETNGHIEVDPIKGGPAYNRGLKSGDKILAVDGKGVEDCSIEELLELMEGEEGSQVKIKVKRDSRILIYNVKRELVQVNPIDYSILDNDIGYIKITEFNQHTYVNLEKALKELDKENIIDIVVDLRDNPGGLLMEVVRSLKLFVPEGPIVHIRYKDDLEQTYYSNLKETKYNLSVLVNENSASASEIFAGAIQDTNSGTILGVTTYGKGTVQMMIPLYHGDGMKLTIAEYLTPNRRSINNKGIVPDIVVKNNNVVKDMQLERAMKLLTN